MCCNTFLHMSRPRAGPFGGPRGCDPRMPTLRIAVRCMACGRIGGRAAPPDPPAMLVPCESNGARPTPYSGAPTPRCLPARTAVWRPHASSEQGARKGHTRVQQTRPFPSSLPHPTSIDWFPTFGFVSCLGAARRAHPMYYLGAKARREVLTVKHTEMGSLLSGGRGVAAPLALAPCASEWTRPAVDCCVARSARRVAQLFGASEAVRGKAPRCCLLACSPGAHQVKVVKSKKR
jgi:hypothetical protein